MQTVAERCNYVQVEDLIAALGYGEVTLSQVVNRWRDVIKAEQSEAVVETDAELVAQAQTQTRSLPNSTSSKSPIAGVEGMLYHIAGCCKPLPGEPIIGVVGRSSKGIAIHRQGCQNIENVEGERIIPVSWNNHNSDRGRPQTYPVDLQVEALDRVGIFKDILACLSDRYINVLDAGVKTKFGKPALISLSIEVSDRQQLEYTLNQIKNMSDVLNIRRVNEIE
jgi:GTP pyrophosphokinase